MASGKRKSPGKSSKRKDDPTLPAVEPAAAHHLSPEDSSPRSRAGPVREPPGTDLHKEADRLLLARYAPPAVVIDQDCDVVQFRGDTSAFLAPAPGKASLALLKMLREGLLVGVRGAIHKARREDRPAFQKGLRVKGEHGYRNVDVSVMPVKAGHDGGRLLVLFEDTGG